LYFLFPIWASSKALTRISAQTAGPTVERSGPTLRISGSLLTKPFACAGGRLRINATVRPGGSIRVCVARPGGAEGRSYAGFDAADAVAFTADAVEHVLECAHGAWKCWDRARHSKLFMGLANSGLLVGIFIGFLYTAF
jgi:hypothetical protein